MINKLIELIGKRQTLYIKLSKNKVEIKHIESGQLITRNSPRAFSNDRLIIADFELAESFMRDLVDELLNKKKRSSKKHLDVVIQIIDPEIEIITPVERRTYRDSIEHIGAIRCWICEHQKNLTDDEVMAYKSNRTS
jgi:hypothetical protein